MDVMATAPTAPGDKPMKTFSIDDATNNITAHATRKEAREAGAPAFATEVEFADAIGNDSKRLVEIWNSLPGVTPVKKFTNRKVGTERIWRAIQGLAGPAASVADQAPAEVTAAVPIPEPETPFDAIEASPDPVVSEPQASIETAPTQVGDQPTPAQAG
jgi:hypothetical protein